MHVCEKLHFFFPFIKVFNYGSVLGINTYRPAKVHSFDSWTRSLSPKTQLVHLNIPVTIQFSSSMIYHFTVHISVLHFLCQSIFILIFLILVLIVNSTKRRRTVQTNTSQQLQVCREYKNRLGESVEKMIYFCSHFCCNSNAIL